MKRTALLLIAVLLTCACGQSTLSYRKDVNLMISQNNFESAAAKVEGSKEKQYGERNALLYYLDMGMTLHDAGKPKESDDNFALAQYKIDELFTKSVSSAIGSVIKSERTAQYSGAEYEKALTYFFRAVNFLDRNDLSGALVEARKAVFNLDYLRRHKDKGYNDDPFVQYFSSLLFEMEGNISSARIARTNALNAYDRFASFYSAQKPNFKVPQDADKMGEVIFLHYNGFTPILTSRTIQVAWNDALLSVEGTDELLHEEAANSVQNAVLAGFAGHAVTVAYPVLTPVNYAIRKSKISAGYITQETIPVHNISALAQKELSDKMPGIMARLVARAVVKQVLDKQAQDITKNLTDDENLAFLAGFLIRSLGAAVEKADTRMWFTLPGEIRMSRMFLPPGKYTLVFEGTNEAGYTLDRKEFENIEINAGQRIFLHHRTGK